MRQRHQQGGETGRDVVRHIVNMGGPAAEIFIPLRTVANH